MMMVNREVSCLVSQRKVTFMQVTLGLQRSGVCVRVSVLARERQYRRLWGTGNWKATVFIKLSNPCGQT